MSKSWYLVHAKPNQEFVADANLRRQGYETFLPVRRQTVRKTGRFQSVRVAHFPCYLFVAIDPSVQRWRPVNHTYGVRRIVGNGERPVPTPQGVVEALKAIATTHSEVSPQKVLKAGERVTLSHGPLAGYDGVVEALVGEDRVRVLLELHNVTAAVIVPRHGCALSY